MLADRRLFLVIRWLQLTTVTVKATIHLTLIQRDFSDSSRECGARGQPPRSAQVSGCAGGSGVSEALALPQSPPCNPDPPERARRGGGASRRHAPSRHRLTPRRPRPLQPGAARAGISNARDCARHGGGRSCTRPTGGYTPASAEPPPRVSYQVTQQGEPLNGSLIPGCREEETKGEYARPDC